MKKQFGSFLFLLIGMQPLIVTAHDISLFGDLLVWKASEETASIWATVITQPVPGTLDFDATNVYFNTKPGFRGGFLFASDPNFWDVKLYWTYFRTTASADFPFSDEQLVTPEFFSGFLSKDIFFGASLEWQLYMNMIDVEMSHQFNVSESFMLRPAIGIKGGWINQTISSEWNADIYTAEENVKNNFSGMGPTLSLNSKWHVLKQINLVGNFQTAFMWGSWDVNDTFVRPDAFLGLITPTTITSSFNTAVGTLMFDYFLGLEWVHKGKSQVAFQLGYEMQYWSDQLRVTTFEQLPVHGDLTLQGGTCRIYIDL